MQTSDHEHQIETSGHEIRYLLNYSRFSDLRILNVGGVGGGGGGGSGKVHWPKNS